MSGADSMLNFFKLLLKIKLNLTCHCHFLIQYEKLWISEKKENKKEKKGKRRKKKKKVLIERSNRLTPHQKCVPIDQNKQRSTD